MIDKIIKYTTPAFWYIEIPVMIISYIIVLLKVQNTADKP